jgi:hypothetical protein
MRAAFEKCTGSLLWMVDVELAILLNFDGSSFETFVASIGRL